jgi:hypothetical protein
MNPESFAALGCSALGGPLCCDAALELGWAEPSLA